MDKLYATLIDTTKTNVHKRIEKEQNQQIAHQMKIKSAMTKLFEEIVQNVKNSQLLESANQGYDKYEIFSFEKGYTFEDFPLIFLTRGPQNFNVFGLQYFEDLNVIPYIKLLQQHFAPFKVYYTAKNGKISVFVSWKN